MLSDALDSWAARRKNEMFVTSLIVAPLRGVRLNHLPFNPGRDILMAIDIAIFYFWIGQEWGGLIIQQGLGTNFCLLFDLSFFSSLYDLFTRAQRHLRTTLASSQELCMQIVRVAETILGPDRRWMVQQVIGGAYQSCPSQPPSSEECGGGGDFLYPKNGVGLKN